MRDEKTETKQETIKEEIARIRRLREDYLNYLMKNNGLKLSTIIDDDLVFFSSSNSFLGIELYMREKIIVREYIERMKYERKIMKKTWMMMYGIPYIENLTD